MTTQVVNGGSPATAHSPQIELAVMGPLEVRCGGRAVEIGGAKPRTLLIALALEANQIVSDGRLVELLWGDRPPDDATDVLRVHIHRLRRALDQRHPDDDDFTDTDHQMVIRKVPGYSLVIDPDQLDIARFQRLIKEARTLLHAGHDQRALEVSDAALELWRDTPLADFDDTPFATAERARLDKLRLEALEDRFEATLRMGLHADNVGALEALAAEHPLRERLQRQLLLALYRCGRQAEASDVYQRTCRRLADDLGMEPGPELQATFREILRQEVPAEWAKGATAGSVDATIRRTNLPLELSSFIGRQGQVDAVRDLLNINRLVTLVGPGGIGKTRLALRLAARLIDEYADGVWLVDLASVIEPTAVLPQVFTALGLREQPGRSSAESLSDLLRRRQALLVLDNCEHLLDATAGLAQMLLRTCPGLSILATSRERLDADGEQAWAVPSLDTPDLSQDIAVDALRERDAVKLFVERARKARESFRLTDANAAAVAQLCTRLDGIPLAIELAAARTAGLSPEQLLDHLGDQFRLLTGSRRASVSRHRTMQETIDWSHHLLSADEQLVFRRVSVFVAGFDLPAATAVCGDDAMRTDVIVAALSRLVDKSLVVYADDVAGEGRYRLLETVRQFAQRKLADEPGADEVRRRCALHFVSLGADLESCHLAGVSSLSPHIDADYSNARACLEWAEGADAPLFLSLAAVWAHYWWVRGLLSEGRIWVGRALAAAEGSPETRARALFGLGRLAGVQGDDNEAERALMEGLTVAERCGDAFRVALIQNGLGIVAIRRGDLDAAEDRFGRAVATWTRLGIPFGIVLGNNNLGECAFDRGRYAEARARFQAAIEAGALLRLNSSASAHHGLANLERHVGNYSAARANAAEALRIAREFQVMVIVAAGLEMFGFIAAAEEQPYRAAVLATVAANLYARCGAAPDIISSRAAAEERLADALRTLDEPTLAHARDLAVRMTLDGAIAFALGGETITAAVTGAHAR